MTGEVRGGDKMVQMETHIQRWQLGILCLQRVWQCNRKEANQRICEPDRFRDSISCGNCKQQFYLEDVSKFLKHKGTHCVGKPLELDEGDGGVQTPERFPLIWHKTTKTDYAEDLSIKSKQDPYLPFSAAQEQPSNRSCREGSTSSLSFTSNPSEDGKAISDDVNEAQDLTSKRSPEDYITSTHVSYLTESPSPSMEPSAKRELLRKGQMELPMDYMDKTEIIKSNPNITQRHAWVW